jgi:hydrogenase maturation protease
MKTLVVGLGNPIRCDDGVGIRVARELARRVSSPDITILEACASGLDFLDILPGHDRAIVIDALLGGKSDPGTISSLSPQDVQRTLHTVSIHDISLLDALNLGKHMGAAMPSKIMIFGIEVDNVDSFSETCTPAVEAAIPKCVDLVLNELKN